MIKIFRRVRQKMLADNKSGKYVLYAAGEIVLVVIGILIALQVNNWNEERKATIAEFELYEVILGDLKLDADVVQSEIDFYTRAQAMHHHVYQESKGLAAYDSTVPYQLLRPIRLFNLVVKSNYSEKYLLMKNDSVKQQLEAYFKVEDYFRNALSEISIFKNEHLRPAFSKYGIHDSDVFFDNYQLDYFEIADRNYINYSKLKELYGTTELDQLLFNLGIKTSWALQGLKLIQEEGVKLRQALENELN